MQNVLSTSFMFALVAAAGVASAQVDFETDPSGGVANGFVSDDDANIMFSDTLGADLNISNFGVQGLGNQSLAVYGDDASRLRMDFGTNVSDITVTFGNDDSGFLGGFSPWAWIVGYNNNVQVDIAGFQSNGDDVMNQSISLANGNFDRVEFYYGDASGIEVSLIEIVDNISTTLVPAPGAVALLGMGGFALARRRR